MNMVATAVQNERLGGIFVNDLIGDPWVASKIRGRKLETIPRYSIILLHFGQSVLHPVYGLASGGDLTVYHLYLPISR
jgi:hypothetical protein